jgi:peptidoglycan/LPS O-acetylase OafA/YrhL
MLFVLAQYLQQGLGRSATYSGLVLVSWVAAFGIAAPVTRRLPARAAPFGGVLGSLILAAAFAAVSAAPAPGPFLVVALGAGAACSFLSARRRAAEVSAAPSEERVPARARAR